MQARGLNSEKRSDGMWEIKLEWEARFCWRCTAQPWEVIQECKLPIKEERRGYISLVWSEKEIRTFLKESDACQRNKGENVKYPGLLQPLAIPTKMWSCITMDFIEGLPNSEGQERVKFD